MKPEPYTLRALDDDPPAPPFETGDLVKVSAIGFAHSGSCGLVIQQHKAEYLLRFRGAHCQWYAEGDLALLSRDPQPLRPFDLGDKVVIAEPGSFYLGCKARITAAATRDPENLEDTGSGFLLTMRGGHFWAKPHHLVRYRNCGKVLAAIAESAPDPVPAPDSAPFQVGDVVQVVLPGDHFEGRWGTIHQTIPNPRLYWVDFAGAGRWMSPDALRPAHPFQIGDVVQAQRPGDARFGWFGTVTARATAPQGSLVQFENGAYWYSDQFLRPATQHELDAHASDDGPDGPYDEPADPPVPVSFKIFDQVVIDNPRNLLHGQRGVIVGTSPAAGLVQMKAEADGEILRVPAYYLRHLPLAEFLAGPPRDEEPEEGEL